ncbi:MAG: carbohydrate ABC transporter substrate-binding protein, partial [Chloroflexota bacterium]
MKKGLLILLSLLVVFSMVLTACTPKETEEVEEVTEEEVTEEEVAPAAGNQLEIFSWWAGDEGPALEALINLYGEKYPDVEVINATVAGGSG